MTREERDNALKVLKNYDLNFHKINGMLFSAEEIVNAFDVAIKALEQEPCEDCVSKAELKKWLDMNFSFGGTTRKLELFDRLDKELPPVTPTRKKGHWILIKGREKQLNMSFLYKCSNCDCGSDDDSDYCPDCGSEMWEE